MEKIIFLDIDGVLNSAKSFRESYDERRLLNRTLDNSIESQVRIMMLDIDFYKVLILKEIVELTGAKIVVTSSWRHLKLYPFVEEWLIKYGLPIIGKTKYIDNNRGEEIREYMSTHKVDEFVILDDDIFADYGLLINNLVKTDFYNNGLEDEHIDEVVSVLGLRNKN